MPNAGTGCPRSAGSWGGSAAFPYAAGTWKLILDAFDGRRYEYDSAAADNPFLRIFATPDFLTVSAPPASKVDWP